MRNKVKRIKQVKDDSNKTKGRGHTDTQLEEDAIYETLILSSKSYNRFFQKALDYANIFCISVEIIKCRDIINEENEIVKLIFSATGSMIIINYYDNLRHVKRLIDEELRQDKSTECTLWFNEYFKNNLLTARMRCDKCYNDYCIKCFYILYDKNEGLIYCPFCRNISGSQSSAHDYGRGKKFKFKQEVTK